MSTDRVVVKKWEFTHNGNTLVVKQFDGDDKPNDISVFVEDSDTYADLSTFPVIIAALIDSNAFHIVQTQPRVFIQDYAPGPGPGLEFFRTGDDPTSYGNHSGFNIFKP